MPGEVKQFLLGRPLASSEAIHQRLSNTVALAVFSSDALSSVAYATEEILLALIVAGPLVLKLSLPIAFAIALLLVIVTFSYRQTIKAYPNGGGAYIVAHENLGANAGLVAGASLLIDYILTVAVSVSAGTAAITSAFPQLDPYRVIIAVTFVAILALANLRGVKESGAVFAGPTYFFVGMLGLTIVVGIVRYALGMPIHVEPHAVEATSTLSLFIILRAFASGCSAMTGVEAIANGVQAFRQPESVNARRTLTAMASILLFLFVGVTILAWTSGVRPSETETVISQLARGVYGGGVLYLLLQAATAAILVLAANTSYADFPRLGSIMAADGYLPKQLKDRGSRLVYSNGLMLLTGVSVMLIVAFGGQTHRLIPLYAVGVFTSFTLSQFGMVIHWRRFPEPGSRTSMVINGMGAAATFVVLLVVGYAKFAAGAWIVICLIPVLVLYLRWIKKHYASVVDRLALPEQEAARLDWQSMNRLHNHVIVLISGLDRRVVRALQYAKTLKADKVEAVFVDVTGDKAEDIRRAWDEADAGIRLRVVESPYREILEPVREYITSIPRPTKDHVVTVIVPEFVPEDFVDNVLHDQTSFWIKRMLFFEPGVVVIDVPYHMGDEEDAEGALARPAADAS